jgi:hypothetical protein
VLLAVITVAAGLVVNKLGAAIPAAPRDMLGDALWAMMMFWIVSAFAPGARLWTRAAAAVSIAFAVELSQLYHAPSIDALRVTTIGHLVLGSDFDARDLVAYAVGVVVAAAVAAAISAGSRADSIS